jgi:dihydroneopterin aldolase
MDRVFIEGLRLDCSIGLTGEERRRPQTVIADVGLFLDLRRAAASGKVQDTIDYREARQSISRLASTGEFTLLESLAEGIASLALSDLGAKRVVVRLRKEKYSVDPSIGIEISRES